MKIKVISTSKSKKGNNFMMVQVLEGPVPVPDTILTVENEPEPKPFKDLRESLGAEEL